jgi:pimeloyl-ACP methyl ester carboxylesterase
MEEIAVKAFRTPEGKQAYQEAYRQTLSHWPVPFTRTWVETDWGKNHVIKAGDENNEPLLLLPGMTVSASMWACNIEALSARYHVMALDTMGDFGCNEPTSVPKTRADYVAWFGQVMDALGLQHTRAMGMSFGGWVLMCFAQEHPERINSLACVAPAASFLSLSLSFIMRGVPLIVYPTFKGVDKYIRWAAVPNDDDPLYNATMDAMIDQLYLGWKHCLTRPKVYPSRFKDDELRRLDVPFPLLLGEQEKIYDPHKACERANALLPQGQSIVIPNGSHDLALRQWQRVNEEVLRFFDE